MNWLGLEGKTAVITGAGGGIGQALARAFAAQGVRVVLVDRGEDRTAPLAAELGQGAFALACDLSRPEEIASAAERVETDGGADILVNNAGILRPGPLDSVSEADWSAMLSVNLTGYMLAAQAFGRGMATRGAGALVHIASIAGSEPQPASGAYSASKAAILMLSRQLAYEWGPKGIRSNTVSPGLVRTPLSEAFYADAETKARREAMVPLRRISTPEDMADVALFIASPRASYVTGQDIVVDGGLSQTLMGLVPRPGYA
ncbi:MULTISPECIES: SDR family NAD(P)-dependent oxidoreductase [Alphaproteobacteria]|uniref:Oxidoreductase n=2 Tax=Alphaproteobacteria TaxID=28211 RepID=A0A512HH81_9HYPH|nr:MULTISPECIES: SDR family oxidoreductase [Alphaproteobacteria]GEO84808.1 oxidoreductase [Ciceribacter naphthalenivorans]GLR20571.1 oxidoreductase [Ciceribacter naphthalenivorans]GLT03427.1 oxidoreductase [Sphingomonas psychrolutea]